MPRPATSGTNRARQQIVDSGYQRHRSDSPAVDDQQVPENARRPADLLAAQPGSAKLVIVPIGLICASCPAGCVLPGGVGKEALDHSMETPTAGRPCPRRTSACSKS